MTGADICKINDKLKSDRSIWDSMWQDIADYIVFRKASITGKRDPGEKLTNKMFDSTATLSADDLVAWIDSNLTSMGMEWYGVKIGELGEDKEAKEWLETCTKIHFNYLRSSNFSSQWLEVLSDAVTFATGAFYVEENEISKSGFNGLNFISMAPSTYCAINGRDGRCQGIYREFEITAQEAIDRWPNKVSEDLKKMAEKDSSTLNPFIQACFPKTWYGGKHKTNMAFASYYVDAKKKTIMAESGYDDFRFFVIPWKRESGETYGRGCSWTALPDVKTLNKAKELGLSDWALGIRPPLAVLDNGVVGSVRLTPGGLTIVKKENAITPILTGSKYSDNRLKESELRQSIKECYHSDKVKFIPAREETGQMTAFEVARRYALAQQLLGPTFGNIVFHGLDPMIETTFNMILQISKQAGFKNGPFPAPPEIIMQGTDKARIEYESPMARSQRQNELASIQNTVSSVAPMEELQPGIVGDTFDLDKTALYIGEIQGIPAKLIRSDKDKKIRRDARAKQQMAAQQMEQVQAGAGAVKDIAGAAKDMPPEAMNKMAGMMGKWGRDGR